MRLEVARRPVDGHTPRPAHSHCRRGGPALMKRQTLVSASSTLLLLVVLALSFVPVALMIVFSLRDSFSIQMDFWALPALPHWSNLGGALVYLVQPLMRTLYVAGVSIAGITLFSSVAAYAFARLQFFGKEVLFYVFLIVLLVPGVLTLTPNFVLATSLGPAQFAGRADRLLRCRGTGLFHLFVALLFSSSAGRYLRSRAHRRARASGAWYGPSRCHWHSRCSSRCAS